MRQKEYIAEAKNTDNIYRNKHTDGKGGETAMGEEEKLEHMMHKIVTANPAVRISTKVVTLDFCEYDLDLVMSMN